MEGTSTRAYASFAIAGLLIVMFAVGVVRFFTGEDRTGESATNFDECAAQGFAIAESYPRQCRTPEGDVFVEDIGNQNDKSDLIRVDAPRPGGVVQSPYLIRGDARGYWFFEASFPIELRDSRGSLITTVIAEAQSDWMTTEFVPFESVLTFTVPQGELSGMLILRRDNPSGLPEHDDSLEVPILFSN